jgi:hypothetical protein
MISCERSRSAAPRSMGWWPSAKGAQRANSAAVASTVTSTHGSSRCHWNSGRKNWFWRRQRVPSLVVSPPPKRGLMRSTPAPFW